MKTTQDNKNDLDTLARKTWPTVHLNKNYFFKVFKIFCLIDSSEEYFTYTGDLGRLGIIDVDIEDAGLLVEWDFKKVRRF